jgi:hypothetical protein
MWPRQEDGPEVVAASVAQTADFLTSYQHHAGRDWDRREIQDAWATGLWLRLTYAKQDAAEGGSQQLDRLATEIDERLERAALK